MKLDLIDLKLLVIFDTLMNERSVTRAAHRLGMTQPALSNGLARLRLLLKDRLFLRGSSGMRPTPRALELAVPVGQALRQLQLAVEPSLFVPALAERTFRFAMSPHAATVIMPPLMRRLRTAAPGVRLDLRPKANAELASMLDANEVDFVVGSWTRRPRRFHSVELFQDRFVCVMRAGHALGKRPLPLKEFAAADHVLITAMGEDTSLFDEMIADAGHRRRVRLVANEYLAALLVVAESDLITAMLNRVFDVVKGFRGLPLVATPLPIGPVRVSLSWHDGLSNHPAYAWLRQEIVAVCRAL